MCQLLFLYLAIEKSCSIRLNLNLPNNSHFLSLPFCMLQVCYQPTCVCLESQPISILNFLHKIVDRVVVLFLFWDFVMGVLLAYLLLFALVVMCRGY